MRAVRSAIRSSDAELTQQLAVLVESLQEEQGIRNSEDCELEEAVRALRLNIEAVRYDAPGHTARHARSKVENTFRSAQ